MSSTLEFALQVPWKRLVNRILRASPLAMARLSHFAGKTAEFTSGPIRLRLTVAPCGEVDIASRDAAADVSMTAKPSLLPRLAAGDEAAFRETRFEGDAEFAQEIAYLARHLEWDVEEDLSKAVGDIVAHRFMAGARDLRAWSKDARQRLGENFKEYLTEERPALVPRRDAQEFLHDVDALRDDVARLEKRINRLASSSQ